MAVDSLPAICTAFHPCNHFFMGMGFRPAIYVISRDQYGDKPILIVAWDGPLEGKVPPAAEDDFLEVMTFGRGLAETGNPDFGGGSAPIVSATSDETGLAPVPLPPSAAALLIAVLILTAWGGGRRDKPASWTKQ